MTTLTRVSGGRLFCPDWTDFIAHPGCGFIAFFADPRFAATLPPSISIAQGLGRGRFLLCQSGFWVPPDWGLLQRAAADWESNAAFSTKLIVLFAIDVSGRPDIKGGITGDVPTATLDRDQSISIEDWTVAIQIGAGRTCTLEAASADELRIRGAQAISLASGGGDEIGSSLAFVQAQKAPAGRGVGWSSAGLLLEGDVYQGFLARYWNAGISYYFGEASEVRLPLFAPWVNDVRLALRARLNPYRHWHGDPFSSSIQIVSITSLGANPRPEDAFLSTLRIADGTQVYLRLTTSSAFVFEHQPHKSSDLVPTGSFAVLPCAGAVPRPKRSVAPLLLGGAGTEFMHVSTDPERPDFIEFLPGMHAYSPIEMNETVVRRRRAPAWIARAYLGSLPPKLEAYRKTSWARLKRETGTEGNAGVEFVLQPHEAPAYAPVADRPGTSLTSAWHFSKNVKVAESIAIPLSPADGIDYADATARDAFGFLEQSVLSPVRVRRIGAAPPKTLAGALAPADSWITTPQGFLVRISNEAWQEIKIASSTGEDANEGESLEVRFLRPSGSPRWVLEDALRHAEVFMVISFPLEPTQYGEIGVVEASVRVRGWKFDLLQRVPPPGEPGANPPSSTPPVLVVKFGKKSTESLVSEFTAWLFPDVFILRGTARSVQQRLQKRISDYKKLATSGPQEQREMYRGFKERIEADNWNGVMAFEATPAGFPQQAAGIEAGIVKSTFSAPYFGIDTNKIDSQPGGLTIARTSFFGLIDYKYPETAPSPNARKSAGKPAGDDPILRGNDENRYGMRVDRLSVLFEDSTVRRFDAQLTLRLGSVAGGTFDEKPKRKRSKEFEHDLKIFGRHEVRVRDGHSEDVYTFVTTGGSRTLQFGANNPILEAATIDRIELRSTLTKGPPDHVKARFAVTGRLVFKKGQGDLLSVDELGFANTAVTLDFDRTGQDVSPQFGFEAGALQAEIRASRPGGLLERLGAELRGFVWSGRSRADASGSPASKKPKKPSDFGYFDLEFPGIDVDLNDFDFALEVEVALGGLGKLLGLQNKLSGRILLGWQWNVSGIKTPALGFKLSGVEGKLEIGIQGLVRFVAQNVALLSAGDLPAGMTAALALSGAFVEVLGKPVPRKKNITLMLVFAQGGPAGWLVAGSDYKIGGGFEIPVLMLGQRMDWLTNSGARWNARELVIEARKNILQAPLNKESDDTKFDPQQHGADFKQRVKDLFAKSHLAYNRETGWSIAAQLKLGDAADVHFVMSDEQNSLYGIHVAVPATASFIDTDVLYRKISDEVGLYAIEIAPPPAFRCMDLGAVMVVLGNLGLDVYTNGNWRLDLGYPRGRDYSRSFSAEIFPFIGFGGTYFGEKSAEVLKLVPPEWNPIYDGHYEYSPVVEFGLAGRFGLGKRIGDGAFRAGLSLTLYGTLEGAFARLHVIKAMDPDPHLPPVHWRLVGTTGILLEGYAVIDFSIIKFTFMLAAWAEVGLALEPGAEIKVSVDLGISVSLDLVIAEIDIPFDGTLKIFIHLHFETMIQQEWSLRTLKVRATALPGLARLKLANLWHPFEYFPSSQPVQLFISRDYSLEAVTRASKEEAEAELQFGLLCSTETDPSGQFPAAYLIVASVAWALKPLVDQSYAGDWNKFIVRADEVRKVLMSLDTPENKGKGGPGYTQIATFFSQNLRFTLSHPASARPLDGNGLPADKELSASYFPAFPELTFALNDREDLSGHPVDLPEAKQIDAEYENALRKYFSDAVEQLKERGANTARKKSVAKRVATELIFEDWFLSFVQAALRAVISSVQNQLTDWRQLERSMLSPSADMLNVLRGIYAEAATLLLAGLRVPAPSAQFQSWLKPRSSANRRTSRSIDASSIPLIVLSGQQVGLEWLNANWQGNGALYLQARSTAPWIDIDRAPAVHPITREQRPYLWLVDRDVMRTLSTNASAIGGQIQLDKIDQLAPAQDAPLEIALGPRFEVGGASKGALWTLPENQAPTTSERGVDPLAATLLLREEPATIVVSASQRTPDKEIEFVPASIVEIILRKTGDDPVSGNRIAFEIVGGNYRAQRHLDILADAIASGNVEYELPVQLLPPLGKADYLERVDSAAIAQALGIGGDRPGIYRLPRHSLLLHQDEGPWIYRSNLARITRPPVALMRSADPDEGPYLANLALAEELPRALTMLKDASALSSGGYWLICSRGDGQELLNRFRTATELPVPLLLKSKRNALPGTGTHLWSDAFNSVYVGESALQGTQKFPSVAVLRFNRSVLRPVQAPGWIRFRPLRLGGTKTQAPSRLDARGHRAANKQRVQDGLLESVPRKFDLLEISTEVTASFEAVSPNKIVPYSRADSRAKDCYNVALPIKNFLKGQGEGARNPYIGVGERVTVKFGLRDVYGNRLPAYEKRTQAELRYFDRLIPIAELPGIRLTYSFVKRSTGMEIALRFDTKVLRRMLQDEFSSRDGHKPKPEDAAKAAGDRLKGLAERFRQCAYQLDPGNKVTAQIGIDGPISGNVPAVNRDLRDFLGNIHALLETVRAKDPAALTAWCDESSVEQPQGVKDAGWLVQLGPNIDLTKPRPALSPSELMLRVNLVVFRDSALIWTDAAGKSVEGSGLAESKIYPTLDHQTQLASDEDWNAFAGRVETQFAQFKVGKLVDRRASGTAAESTEAYLVPQGVVRLQGSTDPSFVLGCAAKPLRQSLASGKAKVLSKAPGNPGWQELLVADVDFDDTMRRFTELLERTLVPAPGRTDELSTLARAVHVKSELAKLFKDRLEWVTRAQNIGINPRTREVALDEFLRDLAIGFSPGIFLQAPMNIASRLYGLDRVSVFGKIEVRETPAKIRAGTPPNAFSAMAKVPLGDRSGGVVVDVAFHVPRKNYADGERAEMEGTLGFEPQYIQIDEPGPGASTDLDVVRSKWLQLVRPQSQSWVQKPFRARLPARSVPHPPKIDWQKAQFTGDLAAKPNPILSWEYSIGVTPAESTRDADILSWTIDYPSPISEGATSTFSDSATLFDCMASIRHNLESGDLSLKPEALELLLREGYRLIDVLRASSRVRPIPDPDFEIQLLVFNKGKWDFVAVPPAEFSLKNGTPLVLTRSRLSVLKRQAAISRFKAYSNLKDLDGGYCSNREFVYESQEVAPGEAVSPSESREKLGIPRAPSQITAGAIEAYLASLLSTISESAPLNVAVQARLCVPKGWGSRTTSDPSKDVPDRYWYFHPLLLRPNVTLQNIRDVQSFAQQLGVEIVEALIEATIDVAPGQRRAISLDISVRGGPFEKIGRVSLVDMENAFIAI